ncbi:Archaeal primase DnaG/twinkle, TOPRIM domain [uncultured Caudovirales phage]|uniref:Archaeal primase DnaG/twinkle, TOPRIM domain n=1 Tax=uncultured Caudovirales phage TaxID=2100421 RepID=A0A6J7X112_9CAUD|nr:Archaeal primase DnaG/twinkle, TOPRIM domain [uncultured Caudovirales phage]
MSDLASILGGPWSPPVQQAPTAPEDQLKDAMLGAGLKPPEAIHLDGKVHRFNSGTKGEKGHDKPGWYIAFNDGVPAGRFGCWRSGVELTWKADIGRSLTVAEEMAQSRRLSEAKAQRDAEQAKTREVAANTVDLIWSQAGAASPEHPYLQRKGIQPNGARITGDGRLMVPLYNSDGELSSIQYIAGDGDKKYHPGGQTGSMYWLVGSMDDATTLYIAEGFATAATIAEVTSQPCAVAYSASNLVPITGILKAANPALDICIVADNDASGVGQRYAEQASAKFGVRMTTPPIEGDANDYVQAGHDLALLLKPQVATDYLVHADGFSEQPAPISWLVKHWIQDKALVMVHGPSGGGKTFVTLDWMLHIASGKASWFGHKVRPGNMVYLAGEGHHGLRSRIAAWKHHNKVIHLNMWVSKSGVDLNTPEGYLRVLESIRALKIKPSVITVDTLHRFMAGDENSAQDAKTMLDACAALMEEFGCTVILVHHTGVSDEAQHRARGSSAWRGALDIEISIVPGKVGKPMEIIQRKSKDAEMAAPVYVELESVAIPGWLDEDGEQVTSAVVIKGEAPEVKSKGESLGFSSFERAWFATGAEDRGGAPYLTRSALYEWALENGLKNKKYTKDSLRAQIPADGNKGKYIGPLIEEKLIEVHENGWIVIEPGQALGMILKKNSP